jgi:NAD(P)-dependent dehydrogenase (short-subunit alcohol dehydrogenase family)
MSGVADRVVVVTGAGRGLGRSYALYLAAEGARVVVNDIGAGLHGEDEASSVADDVVAEIRAAGGQAVASTGSVADSDGARSIIDTALREFGRIDGVVNNAGILRDSSFAKMEQSQWDGVLGTHLFGTYNVIKAAWPHFREQKHGRIVAVTSSTGLFGNFGQANYGAAKQGVVGLIYTLAIEGAKYGIKANALSPMGATRMTAAAVAKADPKIAERLDPIRVAPAIAYLCSDECQESGIIVRAGGGHYSRVAYLQSTGVDFDEVPRLADFGKRWDELIDMTDAKLGGGVGQF